MSETNNWNMIRDAYIFSLPLVLMNETLLVGTNTEAPTLGKAPINQIGHSRKLATAAFRQVVTPNVDTLYSQIFFDLSSDALVLHKPAADRYLSFQVMDAWSDTIAVLGSGADTQDERTYLLTGPSFQGTVPEGMTRVSIPTAIGWIIGRTLCFGPDDLEAIYAIQDQMDARTLSLFESGDVQPQGIYLPEHNGVPFQRVIEMRPKQYFDTVNALLVPNPAYQEDADVMKNFASIGVGPGLTFDPSVLGEHAGEEWKKMLKGLSDYLLEKADQFLIDNGVFRFMGNPISRFGQEYDYRALVAIGGFGANPVDVAVYMRANTDDAKDQLSGAHSYLLHFDALPPVREHGFWSITAYDEENFLIDNPISRYTINDRSDFTLNEDGSLDILLQKDAPLEKPGNWLPSGDTGFHLFLRVYLPEPTVQDGRWNAPSLTRRS